MAVGKNIPDYPYAQIGLDDQFEFFDASAGGNRHGLVSDLANLFGGLGAGQGMTENNGFIDLGGPVSQAFPEILFQDDGWGTGIYIGDQYYSSGLTIDPYFGGFPVSLQSGSGGLSISDEAIVFGFDGFDGLFTFNKLLGLQFQQSNTSLGGLKYADDYSPGFGPLSIPHVTWVENYVDTLRPIAGNGLTETSSFGLGGELTSPITDLYDSSGNYGFGLDTANSPETVAFYAYGIDPFNSSRFAGIDVGHGMSRLYSPAGDFSMYDFGVEVALGAGKYFEAYTPGYTADIYIDNQYAFIGGGGSSVTMQPSGIALNASTLNVIASTIFQGTVQFNGANPTLAPIASAPAPATQYWGNENGRLCTPDRFLTAVVSGQNVVIPCYNV